MKISDMEAIISFNQVNALQRQGIDLCKGCEYEHCASCTDERLPICSSQFEKYRMAKFYATAHTSSEWRAISKMGMSKNKPLSHNIVI